MHLTQDEKAAGALGPERLQLAVDTLDSIGFLAIDNAVEPDVIEAMWEITQRDIAEGRTFPNGENTNQVVTVPPFEPPFSHQQVMANAIVIQITEAAMRAKFTCSFWNTAVALPGSVRQKVHPDYQLREADGTRRTEPHMAWAVYLTDFTEENGATEVYPGTNNFPITKTDESLEPLARELGIPGVRATGPAGTFLLREACLWHRAMDNRTDTPRVMISSMFAPYGSPVQHLDLLRKLEIPRASLEALPTEARHIWEINAVV